MLKPPSGKQHETAITLWNNLNKRLQCYLQAAYVVIRENHIPLFLVLYRFVSLNPQRYSYLIKLYRELVSGHDMVCQRRANASRTFLYACTWASIHRSIPSIAPNVASHGGI